MYEKNLLDEFRRLCENHDLTYSYSDDSVVFSRGSKQYKEIVKFAQLIPRDAAVSIWNEVVDAKVLYSREEFYWSE